jgi:hypothetical protein
VDPRWDEDDSVIEEFIIRPHEMRRHVFGGFDFGEADLDQVLRPPGMVSAWRSDHELEVEGCLVSFSAEPPGWQVAFLAPPSPAWARRVADRILGSMTEASGQSGEVLAL